jgi:ABC-type xylose transport system permease subunit
MRIQNMSEPTTAGLAGIGLGKLLGISVGAVAVAFVVMCLTQPKSRREWVVALVCTLLGSVCGGAFIIQWLGLQAWAETFEGLVAFAGVYFTAGLPAWVLVRAVFAWFNGPDGRSLPAIIDLVRKASGR